MGRDKEGGGIRSIKEPRSIKERQGVSATDCLNCCLGTAAGLGGLGEKTVSSSLCSFSRCKPASCSLLPRIASLSLAEGVEGVTRSTGREAAPSCLSCREGGEATAESPSCLASRSCRPAADSPAFRAANSPCKFSEYVELPSVTNSRALVSGLPRQGNEISIKTAL